jgi:hypothetical protein
MDAGPDQQNSQNSRQAEMKPFIFVDDLHAPHSAFLSPAAT